MNALIPLWIIGGPFLALLFLSFSFKGPSAMGGSGTRYPPRGQLEPVDSSAPIADPMYPNAPRRHV